MESKETNNQSLTQTLDTSKVLVADDDETTRILLRMSLTQWGYQVLEAKDGEEAWKILQEPDPPRILTLDWLMPNLDGIELCKRIDKQLNFRPYIIFLTRMEGTGNMIQGLEAGADEFILKPFDLAELRIRVFAGERIIKYRYQLEEKNKQLQKYIGNVKQLAADYAKKLIPIVDLIKLLQEIHDGLKNLNLPEETQVWLGKLNNLIDIIKNISASQNEISTHAPAYKKVEYRAVPAETIIQKGEAIINMERMQSFFGNDKAGIKDFMKTFLSLANKQLVEIDNAIKAKNMKSAKYFFHLLGSASGNSGMMKLYDVCGKGEEQAHLMNWSEAENCYNSLNEMLRKLKKEIENMDEK